jgi:hypothetical protein
VTIPGGERRWPFNIDLVEKGSVVMTAEQIDDYAQAPRESRKRQFAALRLQKLLDQALRDAGKHGWTTCTRAESLVVLTDVDASLYNERAAQDAARSIMRASGRLLCVESDGFDAEQRAEHDRRVMRNSYLVGGLRAGQKAGRKALRLDGGSAPAIGESAT